MSLKCPSPAFFSLVLFMSWKVSKECSTAVQKPSCRNMLQVTAAQIEPMRQGSHWSLPPAPCRWWDLSFVQLSFPRSSHAHLHQELLPLVGMEDAGHRPSRWPSHSQRLLCCWWSSGEGVLLCTFGEGSWALPQARRRTRRRCLKEAFCGEVRHFCFLCPPEAAWCAWPPP